jgi:hypothetical protein
MKRISYIKGKIIFLTLRKFKDGARERKEKADSIISKSFN